MVRELGGDPVPLLRRAGLPVDALADPNLLIPLDALGRVLELAAEALSRPDFGLRLGDVQDLDRLGPLAVAIRHSTDLGDALEAARQHLTLHNQGSTVVIEADPYQVRGIAGLRFVWHYEGRTYPQAMDKILLNVHRVIQLLAGGDYGLRSVELSYPPAAPVQRYADLFGAGRINAGRPITMLRMPSSLLRRPIQGADTAVRDMALYYLRNQVVPHELATTARVRSALDALLGSGRATTREVADSLEVTPRTLQRRLAAEGSTFAAILDDVRRTKAQKWLAETVLPLADVAAMLDLADQSSLSRAARRWWGTTPTEKRRQLSARS
jgi:AraC-like DNA-binding protein